MRLLYIPLHVNIDWYPIGEDDLYLAFTRRFDVLWHKTIMDSIAFEPDIVYIHSGCLPIEDVQLLREETDALWVQWTGDYRPEELEPITRYRDVVDITMLAGWKSGQYKGHNLKWLPHGVADWQYREINQAAEGIIFIGNNYRHFPGGEERFQLIDELYKRKDFVIWGSGWPTSQSINFKNTPDAYNKCKYGIGGNIYNDAYKYFSNRPQCAMVAGCCYIMRWVPGLDEIFEDGTDCFFYKENEEAIKLINSIPEWRRLEVAIRGQTTAWRSFCYDNIVDMFYNYVA
jgi:hypothetical protein